MKRQRNRFQLKMNKKWFFYAALGSLVSLLAVGSYLAIDRGILSGLSGDRKCGSTPSNDKTIAILAQSNEPSSPKSFSVPIVQKYGGVPAIEVMLNGVKVPMLFDTGASHTLLTARVAKQLRLNQQGKALAETAQGKINFPTATLNILQFGRLQVSNLNVSIADENLTMGLLGQDVFSDYEITISQGSIKFKEIEIPKPNRQGFEQY